jgi:hypothetical protein
VLCQRTTPPCAFIPGGDRKTISDRGRMGGRARGQFWLRLTGGAERVEWPEGSAVKTHRLFPIGMLSPERVVELALPMHRAEALS